MYRITKITDVFCVAPCSLKADGGQGCGVEWGLGIPSVVGNCKIFHFLEGRGGGCCGNILIQLCRELVLEKVAKVLKVELAGVSRRSINTGWNTVEWTDWWVWVWLGGGSSTDIPLLAREVMGCDNNGSHSPDSVSLFRTAAAAVAWSPLFGKKLYYSSSLRSVGCCPEFTNPAGSCCTFFVYENHTSVPSFTDMAAHSGGSLLACARGMGSWIIDWKR